MSVSFLWEMIKPSKAQTFSNGTSSNVDALCSTFPNGVVSTKDIATLRAMHRATGYDDSLWNEIANKLERLQGEDYAKELKIKIWTEY